MKKFFIPLVLLAALGGCYPSSPTSTQTYDLVLSNHDESYDFQSKHTYAISDSVIKITGDAAGSGTKPDNIQPYYSNLIVSAIKSNMAANGWTLVDKLDSPDVILLPAAMESTTLVYYYDWWYWGWYYPGYPGYGWGWYYPGYYPSYAYSYTTGTLFVAMTDPHLTPDNNITVVWSFAVNGLLNTGSNASSRITSTINQAFAQSTYLQH